MRSITEPNSTASNTITPSHSRTSLPNQNQRYLTKPSETWPSGTWSCQTQP